MATTDQWWEVAAKQFEAPPPPAWSDPLDLAQRIDPSTRRTPALDLIVDTLVEAYRTPGARVIISMPPQEGKSTTAARWFPLWALTQNPDLRITVASYAVSLAMKHSEFVRNTIVGNSPMLKIAIADDTSAKSEWRVRGKNGGMYATGIGGALTGRAVDLMLIDDPVADREEAESETYRERAWNWWTDTARTRLAPGAPVVLIMTRWHEDDLAGRLLKSEEKDRWTEVRIPAQCDDEDDPLKRKMGEWMISARGRSIDEWEALKANSSTRTWTSIYQQRPAPVEGAVWKWEWIEKSRQTWGEHAHMFTRIVVAVDPAAKSKRSSDYTGIVVLALDRLGYAWVLDDRTLKGTPAEWAMAAWDALLDWNAGEIIIEDNQGGEMVLDVMRTAWATVTGRRSVTQLAPRVTPVTATKSKRIRAESAAALYETGRVRHAIDGDTNRLEQLEKQMTHWTGDGESPDRIDALGHGLEALFAAAPHIRPQGPVRRDRTR